MILDQEKYLSLALASPRIDYKSYFKFVMLSLTVK